MYRQTTKLFGRGTSLLQQSSTNRNVRFASKYMAAVLNEFGKPLELQAVKQRSLKPNEVRIAVYCCGINSLDLSNCRGELLPKPELPMVPGFEVCGEILEVSQGEDVKKLKPGHRVIGLETKSHKGGFAEEIVVSAKDVFRIDDSISFSHGASLINSYATALLALTRKANVKEDDFVLVTGAGGRLGTAVLDLAVNVYRCKVIAVCASEMKSTAVRDYGAYATVTLGKENLQSKVKKITGGKGVPVIIDTVGGEVFKEVVECVSEEGKLIVAGFASQKIPQISGEELMEKSFSVLGVSLDQYRRKKLEVYRECVNDVIELCKDKHINPYTTTHFALEDVNEALKTLEEKQVVGKAVLKMR